MRTRVQAFNDWFHNLPAEHEINRELSPDEQAPGPDVGDAFRAGWYAAIKEIVRFCEDCPRCDQSRNQRYG